MKDQCVEQEALSQPHCAAPAGQAPLSRFVDVNTLQRLQDRFAALGQVTVCICTVDAVPITNPKWGSPYSELIGASPQGREEFLLALKRRALKTRADENVSCLHGMSLHASAIGYESQVIGLIMVGMRLPLRPPEHDVREIASIYSLDADSLLRSTLDIAPYSGGTPEASRNFADVLASAIATLYGQAARIEHQLADLHVVHDLTNLLSGTLDLQEVLDRTVRRVVEVMPVKACGIRLLDEATGELVIKAVCNLSDAYLSKGPVRLGENEIDVAAFAGETVYIEDVPNDPRIGYPKNALREGIVSGLCVPVAYRGKSYGVLRVYTGKRHIFSDTQSSLLRSIGSQAGAAIANSQLLEERMQAMRVEKQMANAAEIQRRMLPRIPHNQQHLQFGCVYKPSFFLGGDFYDFIDLPEGRIGICVADVVGKGIAAALMMASIRSALRIQAQSGTDLEATLSVVNRHMCSETLAREFATLVCGYFEPDGGCFTYSCAGHPPVLLLRGDRFIELEEGGTVIGIDEDAKFESSTQSIKKGDLLVLYTDGIFEAMNFEGQEYGPERLKASIWKHRSLQASALAKELLWDVRRFAGLAERSDDITIVVVRAI